MRKKNLLRIFVIFCCLVVAFGGAVIGFAQDISPKELEQLKLDAEAAKAKKEIAEAEKAARDANFPKPDVSALVGGTKVTEGTFIETQMLGYCAMKRAAAEISDKVGSLQNKGNLVVYSDADVKMLARYTLMMNRLRNLQRGYEEASADYLALIRRVKPGFNMPGAGEAQQELEARNKQNALGVGLVIDTALKFMTLLKTDIELRPSDVPIGEKELVAEVFKYLEGKGFTLYYPQLIPMSIQECPIGTDLATCSPLLHQMMVTSDAYDVANYLMVLSEEISADIKDYEAKTVQLAGMAVGAVGRDLIAGQVTAIEAKYSEAEFNFFKANIGSSNNKTKRLNALFEVTMNELGFTKGGDDADKKKKAIQEEPSDGAKTCPDKSCSQTTNVNVNVGDKKDEAGGGGGGDKSFASYLQAESLSKIMSQNYSRWIDLKMVKAGGNTRIKNNIFTNLIVGARVNFSGGAIVYYNVFSNRGASEKSGVVSTYEGYRKSSKIDDTCK
jgi:hypothetical protein